MLAADIIRETGISAEILSDHSPEGLSRKENVEELLGAVLAYENELKEEDGRLQIPLTEYLSQVALLTDSDQREDGQPRVTLMTVHAAKGLEFDAVFVTGMEDNLFPNANARFYPREMEEERRLLYVAITRAKHFCYLTYARSRYRYGAMNFSDPSPFLDEIESCYVEKDKGFTSHAENFFIRQNRTSKRPQPDRPTPQPAGEKAWGNIQKLSKTPTAPTFAINHTPVATREKSSSSDATAPLCVGDTIEHARFGIGKVFSLEGRGDNAKACIDFREGVGRKNLLLKFAKIKKI